jgi:hypothetical protein
VLNKQQQTIKFWEISNESWVFVVVEGWESKKEKDKHTYIF